MAIVMKAAIRSKFPKLFPGTTWEWYIIENPFENIRPIVLEENEDNEKSTRKYGAREVTKCNALKYIEDNGLTLVYKTKDGEIYDKPDSDFKNTFKLDTEEKLKQFEKIWD